MNNKTLFQAFNGLTKEELIALENEGYELDWENQLIYEIKEEGAQ